jgi:hypothetical protein
VAPAEGLPAERFLGMQDRSGDANGSGPIPLYPDFPARMREAFGCMPLVVTGPELGAAHALAERCTATQVSAWSIGPIRPRGAVHRTAAKFLLHCTLL